MKKVLFIENDLDLLDIIRLVLTNAGFDVIGSQSQVAIEGIIKQNPSVIIIDYFYSDSYGSEICLQIKANALTKHIPVIFMSTLIGIEKIAQDACADNYIIKPFDIDYLVKMVVKYAQLT